MRNRVCAIQSIHNLSKVGKVSRQKWDRSVRWLDLVNNQYLVPMRKQFCNSAPPRLP